MRTANGAGGILLLVKNLAFTLVAPGTVAVLVPWWIARGAPVASGPWPALAGLLLAFGGILYAWCVWDFARYGRGTPAPIDAPRSLVVRGPYRRVRNPMYLAVLAVILGWAALFASPGLLGYAAAVGACFHLFTVLYEEPHLEREFGDDYRSCRSRVNRWLPRFPRARSASDSPSPAQSAVSLAAFIALAAAAGLYGAGFEPGDWYAGLEKPPLNPPGWVFGPVWSVLYLAMAVAAWLVWRARPASAMPLALWSGQLVLNAAWSLLFFGLRRPGLALVEIVVLFVLVLATTRSFLRVRTSAGALFAPYLAWVGFAVYLNAGLWVLNR